MRKPFYKMLGNVPFGWLPLILEMDPHSSSMGPKWSFGSITLVSPLPNSVREL